MSNDGAVVGRGPGSGETYDRILLGSSIIVTGAGDGLGRAYAIHAASEGASVLVNDVDGARAESVVSEITANGGIAVASVQTVADWDSAGKIVEAALAAFGKLDGLVNNAGVISIKEPAAEEEDSLRATVEVNLLGSLFVGTHVIRVLTAQQHGVIVNITSSAQLGIHQLGAYGATKGALASLTYGWSSDLASFNVRVNAYSPTADTQMTRRSPVPVGDAPSSESNAPIVSYLLSDLARDISGQIVQRRGNSLVVMAHPDMTDHSVTVEEWTTERVATQFGPVLRLGRQPVGDPRFRES
jgi:NAD(P)-dependent dehydrogenase (short-subunit alcohol dehydrogenase family)